MKNFTNIKAVSANLMVLTPSQMTSVKGGLALLNTVTSVLCDDKRRDRPGGGITTL